MKNPNECAGEHIPEAAPSNPQSLPHKRATVASCPQSAAAAAAVAAAAAAAPTVMPPLQQLQVQAILLWWGISNAFASDRPFEDAVAVAVAVAVAAAAAAAAAAAFAVTATVFAALRSHAFVAAIDPAKQ